MLSKLRHRDFNPISITITVIVTVVHQSGLCESERGHGQRTTFGGWLSFTTMLR